MQAGSVGMKGSIHELREGVVQGWATSGATRSGPGGDEAGQIRWEQYQPATGRGTSVVHFHVGL